MEANTNKTIWQEFCYDLVEARKDDILEEPYQNIVEMNLRQLGWSKVQGEICPKERINIGSHNQIEPDITIKIDDKPVFVIEMKRPRNNITPRQEQQLLSYMRLQKTSVGLYIGDNIKMYYDTNEDLPLMVWQIEIDLDAEGGAEFVDFFLHDTFNKQRIENYCKAKANNIKTTEIMNAFQQSLSINKDATIKQVLTDYFVEFKKCNKNLVDEVLQSLSFTIQPTSSSDSQALKPIPSVQSSGMVVSQSSKDKRKRDTTKYSLDGGKSYYGKGRFVREVVARFIEQNPNLTFEQLSQIFAGHLQGSYGVIRSVDSIDKSSHDKKDLRSHYVMSEDLTLQSIDGVKFVVCNQWGAYNFINILNILEKWGWNIIADKK